MIFAEAAREEAAKFVARRRLQAERAALTQRGDEQRAARAAAEADVAAKQRELQAHANLSRAGWYWKGELIAGAVALLGLVSLVAHPLLALVLFGGAILVFALAKTQRDAEVHRRTQAHAELSAQLQAAHARFASATGELEQLAQGLERVSHAIANIVPRRTIRGVARAYYPLNATELAGYPILVDRSGGGVPVTLRVADIAVDAEAFKEIRAGVQEAERMPLLLRPSVPSASEFDTIHGEEERLCTTVERFSEMLQRMPILEESLPLLERTSPLVKYVEANQRHVAPTTVEGAVTRATDDATLAASCDRIASVSGRMRTLGRDVGAQLRDLRTSVANVLEAYRALRTDALRDLHEGVETVMACADLPYTNVYCPKCNRVPEYLFHRLGLDIGTAHELELDDIFRALQRDDEARERLVDDHEFPQRLATQWASIREVSTSIAQVDAIKGASPTGVGVVDTSRSFDARLRAMRNQREQLVRQFQASLRHAVTGNARPLLELSREARLLLDPDSQLWTCAACTTTFLDSKVARMGRMLRVKDELLMPMWNHLWTEKDDLRKSELFRTNEQLQRLIEKEAVALRDVSEQYRADMRPVRENMILSTSDAMTRREQLEGTVQSLAVLGVMTDAAARESVGKLEALTGGDLANYKRRAEAKETLLNQEPQAQIARRVPAIDPVEVLLTPETLFRHGPPGRAPVALSAKGTESS